MLKFGVTLIVILILSACNSQLIPPATGKLGNVEFFEVLVPRIEGVLLLEGKPLAGREVAVARNEGRKGICERPLQTVESDESGQFVLPAVDKKGAPALQASIENDWQVCVAVSEAGSDNPAKKQIWKQIWFDSHSGVKWSKEVTSLTCKLDKLESKRYRGCKESGL